MGAAVVSSLLLIWNFSTVQLFYFDLGMGHDKVSAEIEAGVPVEKGSLSEPTRTKEKRESANQGEKQKSRQWLAVVFLVIQVLLLATMIIV